VLKAAFKETSAQSFHMTPYKLYWQPNKDGPPERIISELYTSDAMINEHEAIKSQAHADDCKLETVVAAIILWSDSTHLASLGNALLWPIYLFLGNQSKYTRNKLSAFAAHHLAYIPKVCLLVVNFSLMLTITASSFLITFKKSIGHFFSKMATGETMTHWKQELMHAIWSLLLDDEFLDAYEHGIVIKFADGIL
ncbi:hypothetical protein SERLA73DRAFT_46394, partial [Serpula lacrymans var. lacrymans S7.3]